MNFFIFILVIIALTNKTFSQINDVYIKIDSSKLLLVDTNLLFNYYNDNKIILRVDTDLLLKRKILTVLISNSNSHYIVKRYDLKNKNLIEITNQKKIKNTIYLQGYFYRYLTDSNLIVIGKYKKDYYDGLIFHKDTLGNIYLKQKCYAQRKICRVKEFYNNKKIKKTYYKKFNTLYYGVYKEYYPNGKIKIKGKFKVLKVKNPIELNKYNAKKIIWISKNKGYISFKTGIWNYYDVNGSIEKKECYKN